MSYAQEQMAHMDSQQDKNAKWRRQQGQYIPRPGERVRTLLGIHDVPAGSTGVVESHYPHHRGRRYAVRLDSGQLLGYYASELLREDLPERISRNHAITEIRAALQRRSGKPWSVTGGRGTAYGWIHITAPPRRRDDWQRMTVGDCAELAELLGLDHEHCFCHKSGVGRQGHDVPAAPDYYLEWLDRANGREPRVLGQPYWD